MNYKIDEETGIVWKQIGKIQMEKKGKRRGRKRKPGRPKKKK